MIRNHRVLFWTLLNTLILPCTSFAQQKGALWLYPNLNASWLQSDLNTSSPLSNSNIGPGGGLRIGPSPRQKRLSPAFQAGLGRVTAQNPAMQTATDPTTGNPVFLNKYVETTLFQTEVAFRYQLTRHRPLAPYLMAGIGLQFYFAKDQGGVPLILDQTTRPLAEASYSSLTAAFPVGAGLSYAISPGLEIQCEYSLRFLGSDHLDNIASMGSRPGNDRIQSVNIAVGIPLEKTHSSPTRLPSRRTDTTATLSQAQLPPLPAPDTATAQPAPTVAVATIDVSDTCNSPCLAFVAISVKAEPAPVRPDSAAASTPSMIPETATQQEQAGSPQQPLPTAPRVASAAEERLQAALALQEQANLRLQDQIRILEAKTAQQATERDSLVALLMAQSVRLQKMTYDSTQLVLLAKTIDEENSALTQQLRNREAACATTTQRLRDSLTTQNTTIETLRNQAVPPQATQAAEGQLTTARIEALEKKLTELSKKELEIKQLQQISAYFVAQHEASMAQDVFVIAVSAEAKDRPLAEWLAHNKYMPEKMPDGAHVYFGVYLPEVSTSPLRLRVQTTRLSTGQWVVQVLARRSSDGSWISPASSPAEADLLRKWLTSLY